MKAKKSPLKLLDFSVFESKFDFIPPNEESNEISDKDLQELPISFDFDQYEPKDGPENRKIIEINIKINDSGKKIGYSMNITASGIFEVYDYENLEEKMIINLLGMSSLNLMINNLRGYLINITTYAPLGVYVLPPIDIGDLIEKKKKKKEQE